MSTRELFSSSVLEQIPKGVNAIATYVCALLNDIEIVDGDMLDSLLNGLIPQDNSDKVMASLGIVIEWYYHKMIKKYIQSLDDTFDDIEIDQDITDYLIGIESKCTSFMKSQIKAMEELVVKFDDLHIDSYTNDIKRLLAYLIEKKCYHTLLTCYRSIKKINIDDIFKEPSFEQYEAFLKTSEALVFRNSMKFFAGFVLGYRITKAMKDSYLRIKKDYHNIIKRILNYAFYKKEDKDYLQLFSLVSLSLHHVF